MTHKTETVVPGEIATEDEPRYENRYEAIGAAVLEVRRIGGDKVVVHADDCRYQTLRVSCPCGPIVLAVK